MQEYREQLTSLVDDASDAISMSIATIEMYNLMLKNKDEIFGLSPEGAELIAIETNEKLEFLRAALIRFARGDQDDTDKISN